MPYPDRLAVDGYVIDALMPDLVGHDRRASAFIVYLYLWRRTRGGAQTAVVSHGAMADGTGLAKRSVQTAFQHLLRRGLIKTKRSTSTSAPVVTLFCEWRH